VENEVAVDPANVASEDGKLPEQNTPAVTATNGVVEPKQDEPVKTFTQAEVDALVQKRLLKEERRVHRRIEQQLREQKQSEVLQKEPSRAEFRDDEAFTQAQIDHLAEVKAAQKLAERERTQQQNKAAEAYLERAEQAAERYTDFQAVVSNPMLVINEGMVEFIADSEHGPDVAYYLGKNPTKAAEIAQLSPVKAARELSRIESEIASKPKATPSRAPEPISPVGTRGKASSSPLPSDDDDTETWMRKEKARMAQRR
jgi:hypothetical protein